MLSGIPQSVRLAFNLYVVWAIFYLLLNSIAIGVRVAETYEYERLYAVEPGIGQTLRQMGYSQLGFQFILVLGTGYLIRTNQRRGKVLFILYTLGSTYLNAATFPDFEDLEALPMLRDLLDSTLTISISVLLLKSLFTRRNPVPAPADGSA